jgi:lipopolysaccharide cholinephosphotransferase
MSGIDQTFFEEEVRWDFLVEKKRKRVRAAELEMLEKLDGVCKKWGITSWVFYRPLLGTVRHKGFISWEVP